VSGRASSNGVAGGSFAPAQDDVGRVVAALGSRLNADHHVVRVVGMLHAWTLLGDPQYGLSGWLSPLQDFPHAEAVVEVKASVLIEADPLDGPSRH
jgi:hypothetical protein